MKPALARLCVKPDATVLDALRVVDAGGHAIAFVCGGRGRVLGLLTDGDLRRALLAGATLESRVLTGAMRRDFAFVRPEAGRAEALELMRARHIEQLPIIDAEQRLVGLHTLHELIGRVERPNWAVIMAGGRGTRLWPITQHVPKPMVHVAGRPILERLVLHLVGHGIRHVWLAVNYLHEMIEEHFGDGRDFGCEIRYLHEQQALGTGGPLALLPERPLHPLLVMNGDLVTQADIGRMLEFHERGKYAATFGLRPYGVDIPFGVATVQGDRVVELREKPTERMHISAGIYVLSPRLLKHVPGDREYPITELFAHCLRRGWPLGAHVIEDEWLDVGRPSELSKARGTA
jgi:dTDP-glucose pyrophosphorylase